MTLRDLIHRAAIATSLPPAARTNGTATGTAVDLRGFDAAIVAFHFGTWTDGVHTPSIQHSVDGITYTTVAAADLDGSLAAISSAGGSNTVQSVGYIGTQRYLRAMLTTTGATTGALVSANVISGYPR